MADTSDTPGSEAPNCPSCGELMTFVRMVPRVGPLPELRSFHCLGCREAATIPIEE